MRSILIVLALFILAGCGGNGQPEVEKTADPGQTQVAANPGMSNVLSSYYQLKDDLVAANSGDAQTHAKTLATALRALNTNTPADSEAVASALQEAEAIGAESDLAKQRTAFLPLSEALIMLVKSSGAPMETVYVQHCPMAFGNTGGDWLSSSKEIMNPYFGDKMLHCGTVKETLASQ